MPFVNFAPLQNAVARLLKSAAEYKSKVGTSPASLKPEIRAQLNTAAIGLERTLTRAEGLPGRPWFKHQVYAPGLYTGYGVKTLPAIREALELRQWTQAAEQVDVVARTLDGLSAELERLAKVAAP